MNPAFCAARRRPHMPAAWLAATLVGLAWPLASAPAIAQDAAGVYRCGNTYQSKPCAGGKVVDAADPRSADQVQQARQAARQDAALARQMAAERRADERNAARLGAANVGPVAAKPAAPAASKAAKTQHRKKPHTIRLPKPPKPPKAGKPAQP